MATWDDHDFGLNDAGGSFPMRRWAETLFETFWASSEAVRSRPGIYESTITGPEGKRVQVILLDTRFFRSDLKRAEWTKDRPPLGGYVPDDNPAKTVLGAEQWAWLKAELAKPADLRIVVSSTQVITQAHQFEGWTNFPAERAKLLDLLAGREASGLVMLSGAGLAHHRDRCERSLTKGKSAMATTITGKLNKAATQFQAGESTGFGLRLGVKYYDRESKMEQWCNYRKY